MVEARLQPAGPYSLKLTTWTAEWSAALPDARWAEARQLPEGTVVVRASCEQAIAETRFVLALDDDTSEFHRRFAADPLLGRAVRALRGLRPERTATVAHATLKAVCGQLIQSRRARDIERAVVRACAENPPSREALARLSPAKVTGCGLAPSRAATLARLVRTIDLEALRTGVGSTEPARSAGGGFAGAGAGTAPERALARLARERGIGPWSVGVIALRGLGRYDAGLVADLGLVKLLAARTGRWPEPAETAALLAPYEEWQGLASVFLLAGFKRGLVPGANRDRARLARATAWRAA